MFHMIQVWNFFYMYHKCTLYKIAIVTCLLMQHTCTFTECLNFFLGCTVHFWWVNKRITFSSLLQRVSPSLWEKSETPANCLTYFSLHLTLNQTYVKGLDFCVLKWSKEWKNSSILWQILFYLSCSLKLEFFKTNLLVWYIVCSGNWYVCKHIQLLFWLF